MGEALDWRAWFSPQGLLARQIKGFEPRPQQARMAQALQEALNGKKHLVVEAGTGVGKSLAYLLPAALWAVQNDRKVVVSTFTRALQEQLLEKDLPKVQKVLSSLGHDFRYALLMGANNYLCLDRLERANSPQQDLLEQPVPPELFKEICEWAKTSATGLRSKLPVSIPQALWDKIARDPDLCLAQSGFEPRPCLYQKDLVRARKADLLVINHHLFFAAQGSEKFDAVIFDEAHTLEEAACRYLGVSVSDRAFSRLLDDLHNPETGRGLARRLNLENIVPLERIDEVLIEAHKLSRIFFDDVLAELSLSEKENSRRIRKPLPEPKELIACLAALEDFVSHALGLSQSREQAAFAVSYKNRLHDTHKNMEIFFKDLKKDCAYWGERALTKRGPVITLKAVPVDVSQMLREQVFKADRSVILTSATLAVGGSFKAQKERVGLGESLELLLDSPFDYAARSAIFAPCGLPDPKENPLAHEQAVLENCRALSEIVPGGIFFLFTSWSALKRAHQFIVENVKNRPIFKQGDEPAYSLTEKFKKAGNGLLLGTDTFWQGVDVPGRALSCVVITRLPFTSPADPLEEARIEWIAAQGKNVFNDYSVPRAVIKFRQGFGRLIRTHQDLGAVVILDPRVQTKSYGQIFLKSLPACKTVKTLEDLASFFRTAQPICARI